MLPSLAVATTSYPPRLRVQDEVCLGGDGAMSQLVVLQDDVRSALRWKPVQKFAAVQPLRLAAFRLFMPSSVRVRSESCLL